jgi:acetate kinase
VESIVGARRLLTINTGSSSLKAALYRLREDTTETPELRAEASRIGGRGGGLRLADARSETLDERRDDETVDSGGSGLGKEPEGAKIFVRF